MYFSPKGSFLGQWGNYGASENKFNNPCGVAVSAGVVFIADTGNDRVQYFSPTGEYFGQFGGPGKGPGEFNEPVDIAVSTDGTVYVTDRGNYRVQYFRPVSNE